MKKYKNYYWLNEDSLTFLKNGYIPDNIKPETHYRKIAESAEKLLNIEGFADKFEGYLKRGFYSLSTPIITNFGNKKGLPVSCFGSFISDSIEEILNKSAEIGTQCKNGGGTSAFFGDIRSRGSEISGGWKSEGAVSFLDIFQSVSSTVSQSSARRGHFAATLPVEHGDIKEFLKIKTEGHPIQHISIGVTITNKWMDEMIKGDKDKRDLWAKIIQRRFESGYPYVMFIDNVNNNSPQVYKDKNLKIKASNMCQEIALFSDKENSFVCVLSSLNLLHWDEIVNTDAVETLLYFLDAVNEEFIIKTEGMKFMESSRNFAKSQRALGLGVLGWHSYLQSKLISFESIDAKFLNNSIFKTIRERAEKATVELAKLFGEPEMLKGYGRRNVSLLALAPTTASSFILAQVSPSIEPLNSNYFVKDLAKGKFTYKNPYLEELLIKYDKNTDKIWKSILIKGGSVQHLDFLNENEKSVFKTFAEISQKEIIIQAAQRQKYIDQGQSLNITVGFDVPAKDVSKLMIEAWEMGVKNLYYQRGTSPTQEFSRSILECKSCEA